MRINPDRPNFQIELEKYADGSCHLTMSAGDYMAVNGSALSLEGQTLGDLSQSDPHRAYQFMKAWARTCAGVGVLSIEVDGLKIDTERSGPDAVRKLAGLSLLHRMPDEYDGPVNFSVGIYTTEDDRQLFGADLPERLAMADIILDLPEAA